MCEKVRKVKRRRSREKEREGEGERSREEGKGGGGGGALDKFRAFLEDACLLKESVIFSSAWYERTH